jgi:hypothetical protein
MGKDSEVMEACISHDKLSTDILKTNKQATYLYGDHTVFK